ncbi:glycoside hydrolase family 26 protein [Nocardioides sp.]
MPLGERVRFGADVAGADLDLTRVSAFEQLVGHRVELLPVSWRYGDDVPEAADLLLAASGGQTLVVAWDLSAARFADWASGDLDRYLELVGAALRSQPGPVYLRPWPEMNGDWQTYQPTPDGERPRGGTYAEFRAAWRHVVERVDAASAGRARWVFSPSAATRPGTTPVGRIWPGDDVVDVLGIDAFNWGESVGSGRWRSFARIVDGQYRRLTALDATAPVWITAVGSKEPRTDDGAPVDAGHSKADWVRDLLADRALPRIEGLIWAQRRAERDWRIDSSPGSLRAFRRGIG